MTSMNADMNPDIARKLKRIGDAFCIKGPFFSYEDVKMGNVNHTYKVNFRLPDGMGLAWQRSSPIWYSGSTPMRSSILWN